MAVDRSRRRAVMASAPIGSLPSGEALAVSVLAVIASVAVAGLIVLLLVRLVRRLFWRCLSAFVGMVTGVGVHAGAYQVFTYWLDHR